MKLTKPYLRKIIKEEVSKIIHEDVDVDNDRFDRWGHVVTYEGNSGEHFADNEITVVIDDISDAIQMLESEDDSSGTLFHVINRLYEALERLQKSAPGAKK